MVIFQKLGTRLHIFLFNTMYNDTQHSCNTICVNSSCYTRFICTLIFKLNGVKKIGFAHWFKFPSSFIHEWSTCQSSNKFNEYTTKAIVLWCHLKCISILISRHRVQLCETKQGKITKKSSNQMLKLWLICRTLTQLIMFDMPI